MNDRFAPMQPDGRDLVETVYVRFNQNPDAFENGPHVATVTVDLLTAARRNARLDDLFRAWREEVGPESYEIDVRFRSHDRDSAADFEDFHFRLPGGGSVPLGAVADVETQRGWSRIARVNGMRTVTLRGDVDSGRTNTTSLISEIQSSFLPQLQETYSGAVTTTDIRGESVKSGKKSKNNP